MDVLSKLADYETEIIPFVQSHQQELSQRWQQWLAENPLPTDMLALLNSGDKIEVLDVGRYRVIEQAQGIEFIALTPQDPEWSTFNCKFCLELREESHSQPRSKLKPPRNNELLLAGIGYRLLPAPGQSSLLLHLDYLITRAAAPAAPPTLPSIPKNLPQQTFMEARNMAIAIADGPKMVSWEKITGEIGLRHVMPGNPLQTRILLSPSQNPWDLPSTCEELSHELQKFELASVLLLNVIIGAVIPKSRMTASIDDLLTSIGWRPRSRVERAEMRHKVWRWLQLFDSMTIHGKRPGKYYDKLTRRELDLTSADALIRVTGRRFEADPDSDSNTNPIPLEVSWVAGNWLDQWRGNDRVLQYFGDIRKIASISAGRASGAWAQSIGLSLNQLWRERAARAEIRYAGEENKITVAFQPFTRWELLNLFRTQPWVEEVLASTNPQRAQDYWQEAVRILRYEASLIGHYEEVDPPSNKRKGWQEFWLKHQQIDIRPKKTETAAAAEIARTAARAKRQARRNK